MDAPNEKVKPGDAYISLDIKSKAVFYQVERVDVVQDGSTWIKLAGLQFQDSIYTPLLFLDKSFAKVNESTVNILFGKGVENGNESKKAAKCESIVKQVRGTSKRRASNKKPARLDQAGKRLRS